MEQIDRFFKAGLKLSHLRVLVLFDRLGQIRLVAEELNLTQPAISKQVTELEAGLNAEVLVRLGNRLFLTPVGDALVKRAKEVFHQLERARYEVDALTSGVSGTISLGAVATVMPVFGPEFVSELRKLAPNVGVDLHEATSDRLFPLLSSGSLDFVLSRTEPMTAEAQQMFDSRVMLKDPFVISCGRQHPLAVHGVVSPLDLQGLPWILPPPESPTYTALQTWMASSGLSFPAGCVHSISLPSVETLLSTDNYLALLPLAIVRNKVNRERLTTLGVDTIRALETVKLFYRLQAHKPAVQVALRAIDTVQAKLMQL